MDVKVYCEVKSILLLCEIGWLFMGNLVLRFLVLYLLKRY